MVHQGERWSCRRNVSQGPPQHRTACLLNLIYPLFLESDWDHCESESSVLPSKTQWTVSDNITVYRPFYFKKTLSPMNMPKEAFPDLLCLIRQILDTVLSSSLIQQGDWVWGFRASFTKISWAGFHKPLPKEMSQGPRPSQCASTFLQGFYWQTFS